VARWRDHTLRVSSGRGSLAIPSGAAYGDDPLNYLSIPAVEIGLRQLQAISSEVIAERVLSERVRGLTGWLLDKLVALRHSNPCAMLRIYGPTTTENRGGTATFNLYDPQGHLPDCRGPKNWQRILAMLLWRNEYLHHNQEREVG
jgi:molybdenum cofactor sulfurtransferase